MLSVTYSDTQMGVEYYLCQYFGYMESFHKKKYGSLLFIVTVPSLVMAEEFYRQTRVCFEHFN